MAHPAAVKKRRLGLAERLQLWSADHRIVDRLWVGVSNVSKRPSAEILGRVEEALGVICSHDPRRYARVCRTLDRVWVRLQVARNLGSYNNACNACELDLRYVLREDVLSSDIASTIVHEATHARLERFGYSEAIRARIEAVCRGQERAFAERLPQPGGDRIREKLEYWDNATGDLWSRSVRERQLVGGIASALEYVGIPAWLGSVITSARRVLAAVRRLGGGTP